MVRVTQLCQISQFCRKLARDAGLVALAAAHAPSVVSLVVTASIQRVWGHAAWARLCQIARKWSKRDFSRSGPEWSCAELFVWFRVRTGEMLSTQAGRGAVTRCGRGGNGGWHVRSLRACVPACYRPQKRRDRDRRENAGAKHSHPRAEEGGACERRGRLVCDTFCHRPVVVETYLRYHLFSN